MSFKLPSITVYETTPTKNDQIPTHTDQANVIVPEFDDSVEIFEPDFRSTVQKFNRVILLVDDNSDGELPKIRIEPNKIEFDESVTEMLKRLHDEFNQFEDQFNKDDEGLPNEHIDSLRNLLNSAQDRLIASTLFHSHSGDSDTGKLVGTKQQVEYVPADLSKMSERLSVISTSIGQSSDLSKRFTQPFDFVVEELGLQLDAIPPNGSSNSDLNFVLSEYGKQNKDDNATKINEIYETLNRWNSECQALPLILERLRHCAILSEQAEHLSNNKLELLTSADAIYKTLNKLEGSATQTEKLNAELLDLIKKIESL